MKSRLVARNRVVRQLPFLGHLLELVAAIIILAGGQNIWAAIVQANPDVTPPSVPTGLALSGRSATEIDLTWAASTDNVGVTGYNIYRNGTQVGSATDTNYSDLGLSPNTTYTYTVTAFDAAANESAQSTGLPASTLADTSPPSTPTNLHQTGQTTTSVTIAWNASSDNVGVTGYNIYRNGSLIKTQAGTTYTDTGLAVYTGYLYNVTAFDAANNGSAISSTLVANTAPDVTPPSVPDNVHETGSTITSVTLAWDASTDDVGVAGYHVYRNGTLVGSPGGASFTDTGLTVSSNYTYTISAYDAAGNVSAQSAPFSASSSNDTTPPTIPTGLHSTSVLDNAVSIAWTASTDDVGVAGYKVYRNGSLVGTTTGTGYNDTGLQPVTGYAYTVVAYDAASNNSAASAPLNVTTAFDTTPPSSPTGLQSTSQTDTSVSLSWSAATDNVGVSGYNVYRGNTLVTSTIGTSYTDSGLGVNTSYTYRVQAYDSSGNTSVQSSPLTVSTLPDTIAPAAPANLVTTNQTTTSVSLSWDSATDDVAVTGYRIYRNGVLVTSVSGTSFTDSGLRYNTSFSYTVTAVDAAANESPPSNTLATSTLPDTTAPTVNLTTPGNSQTLSLTFPIGASASDDLDLNRVEFFADTTLIATITSAPYTFNWDSYAVHNGAHTLTAEAFDASGNNASQSITININNPPPPLVGDLNGDHKVNLFDLSILLSHWGKPGSGDLNGNGRVDIFDLSILLSHHGQDDSNYH